MNYTYNHNFRLDDLKRYMKLPGYTQKDPPNIGMVVYTNAAPEPEDQRLNDCLTNAIDTLARYYSICTCETTIEAYIMAKEWRCRLGVIASATATSPTGEAIECAFFSDRLQLQSCPAKVTVKVTDLSLAAPSTLVFPIAAAMYDGVTDTDSWGMIISKLIAPYARI